MNTKPKKQSRSSTKEAVGGSGKLTGATKTSKVPPTPFSLRDKALRAYYMDLVKSAVSNPLFPIVSEEESVKRVDGLWVVAERVFHNSYKDLTPEEEAQAFISISIEGGN